MYLNKIREQTDSLINSFKEIATNDDEKISIIIPEELGNLCQYFNHLIPDYSIQEKSRFFEQDGLNKFIFTAKPEKLESIITLINAAGREMFRSPQQYVKGEEHGMNTLTIFPYGSSLFENIDSLLIDTKVLRDITGNNTEVSYSWFFGDGVERKVVVKCFKLTIIENLKKTLNALNHQVDAEPYNHTKSAKGADALLEP